MAAAITGHSPTLLLKMYCDERSFNFTKQF